MSSVEEALEIEIVNFLLNLNCVHYITIQIKINKLILINKYQSIYSSFLSKNLFMPFISKKYLGEEEEEEEEEEVRFSIIYSDCVAVSSLLCFWESNKTC
jgi:hypothetical protein